MAFGVDAFSKTNLASNYISYDTTTYGGGTRLGFQLREDVSLQVRYQIYRQEIELPSTLNNCNNNPNNGLPLLPTPTCFGDGEASLPVRIELSEGPVLTSLVGYTLAYNSLDNTRNPRSGIYAELKQDFAGVGGDVQFVRTTVDTRTYYEVLPDVVGLLRLQGGNIAGWDGNGVRMLDSFKLGPNLVRGFAPAGIGPRDLTPGTANDALGGTLYWGASLEFQTPLFFLPKEVGMRGSVYADAGSLWDYQGPTTWALTGETLQCPGVVGTCFGDSTLVRSSVGVGLIWDSPFGPLRFDYAVPLTKEPFDRIQQFRFGGGTKF
jgi:outer membrane protein insertion porin family